MKKKELVKEDALQKKLKGDKDKVYVGIGELVHEWEEAMKTFYETPGPFMKDFWIFWNFKGKKKFELLIQNIIINILNQNKQWEKLFQSMSDKLVSK